MPPNEPLRLHQAADDVIRRVPNEWVGTPQVDDTPALKDELAKQYKDKPSDAFDELWRGPFLTKLQKQQAKGGGGRPQRSHARLARLAGEERDQNDAVRVHGWIGSLEAGLRGSLAGTTFIKFKKDGASEEATDTHSATTDPSPEVKPPKTVVPTSGATSSSPATSTSPGKAKGAPTSTGKPNKVPPEPPYDGGHLVAYQFMGPTANVYRNVAPQGKSLNNGPFQNWEKKVVGAAIVQTGRTLGAAGVKEPDLPHTFDYKVYAFYSSSKYQASPEVLAAHGLIPPEDVGELSSPVQLTKRIPLSWSAFAQPLPLPSAAEMGIERRPDTPYMFAQTRDYGLVDKSNKERTNREFMARGPADLVDKFAGNTDDDYKFARPIASNASKTSFAKLVAWKGQGDQVDLDEVLAWLKKPYVSDTDTVVLQFRVKAMHKKRAQRILDSDWIDSASDGVTYTPTQIRALLGKVAIDPKAGGAATTEEVERANRYLDDKNKVSNAIDGQAKKKSAAAAPPDRSESKDTKIDFSGTMNLESDMLLNSSRFQFSAKETQPS